jgi:hypothetical protein
MLGGVRAPANSTLTVDRKYTMEFCWGNSFENGYSASPLSLDRIVYLSVQDL